jgi:hypothetical protein
MATLPNATLVIDESSGSFSANTDYVTVLACVTTNADSLPRLWASSQDLLAFHGYAPGVDYAALHFQKTQKPVVFVGMPITTQGTIGSQDTTGNTGTSAVSVAAGSNAPLDQVQGSVTVQAIYSASTGASVSSGAVGTDQFVLSLSMDGGKSSQTVKLGANTSYAIPQLGLTLNFGPGTLNLNDVPLTFVTTAPMWGSTAMSTARNSLAAQQRQSRSWMVVGDLPNSTFAGYVTTETNNYETINERYVYARAQVSDRSPLAKKSKVYVQMVGGPSITFDGVAHTITRGTGSFITDGFAVGDMVTVAGSVNNNATFGPISNLTATVMTFAGGLTTEGPDATGVTIIGSEQITFAAAGHTITRGSPLAGSWLLDGFAIGQSVTISGTANNNLTATITNLTATVMTFAAGLVNEGPNMGSTVSVVQSLTMGAWVAAQTAAFATVDAQRRIDLGLGRAFVQSPITGWIFRRPCQWAVSCREYTHDVQIPTYRKDDGPLDGFSIADNNGNSVEFDDRSTSTGGSAGGVAGRFTCLRSYGNGPLGAFVALALTRDTEGLVLSRTHNMAVTDLGSLVVQNATEQAIGQVLDLNTDGTATKAALGLIEKRVNKALQINLLQQFSEGKRASSAVWKANTTDNLSIPGALFNGTLNLVLDGTLEQIKTRVRVNPGLGA